jgi:hypothetical protein
MTSSILMFVFISVLKAYLLSNNSLHFRYFKKIVQADTPHGLSRRSILISSPYFKRSLDVLKIGFKLTGCVVGYRIVLIILVIYDCYRIIKWLEITFNKFHHHK